LAEKSDGSQWKKMTEMLTSETNWDKQYVTVEGNDFKLILAVKMETRHPV